MPGPIVSSLMLPFIFLAPVQGAHYDRRRPVNLAHSSRLRARAAVREGDGAAYLPADQRELSQLCHTVGFELACLRMLEKIANSSEPRSEPRSTRRPVARSKTSAPRRAAATSVHNGTAEKSTACLPPGQLVFAHVLRTGGLTVDSFLDCQCESWDACSVRHADSDLFEVGSQLCEEATVCTMHRGVAGLEERCGPAFTTQKPRMFTVIRDPLERVWSFFHYLRHWYPPYQQNKLPAIYENFGADLNAGLPAGRKCAWCGGELSNALTLRYFCRDAALCDSLSGADMPALPLMARALAQAKVVLASMDAVFMTEDLDHFDRMFIRDRRLYAPLADAAKKPFSCHVEKPIIPAANEFGLRDPDTIRMISKYNRADIMLYKYAMALPNHWAREARVPGDGKPWQAEYIQTDADRLLEAAAAEEAAEGIDDREIVANDTDATMENATANDTAAAFGNETANDTATLFWTAVPAALGTAANHIWTAYGMFGNETANDTATLFAAERANGTAASPWSQEAEDLAASMDDESEFGSGVVISLPPVDAA